MPQNQGVAEDLGGYWLSTRCLGPTGAGKGGAWGLPLFELLNTAASLQGDEWGDRGGGGHAHTGDTGEGGGDCGHQTTPILIHSRFDSSSSQTTSAANLLTKRSSNQVNQVKQTKTATTPISLKGNRCLTSPPSASHFKHNSNRSSAKPQLCWT